MTTTFTTIITDEAVAYARTATVNPGWHLIPKRWAISDTVVREEMDILECKDMTYGEIPSCWITQTFSAIYNKENNKLGHSVIIPPNVASINKDTEIAEIYFIYQDYFGNEFLFAVARPDEKIMYSQGTGQGFLFEFTLNNIDVPDVFQINYTYPQEIEDHNTSLDAHANLLANLSTLHVKHDDETETLIFYNNGTGVGGGFIENPFNKPGESVNLDDLKPYIKTQVDEVKTLLASNVSSLESQLSTVRSNCNTSDQNISTRIDALENNSNIGDTNLTNRINSLETSLNSQINTINTKLNQMSSSLLPDYSKGSGIGFPYTATRDGWVFLVCSGYDWRHYCFVNGQKIAESCGYSGGKEVSNGVVFPVSAGDVVHADNAAEGMFYPMK